VDAKMQELALADKIRDELKGRVILKMRLMAQPVARE